MLILSLLPIWIYPTVQSFLGEFFFFSFASSPFQEAARKNIYLSQLCERNGMGLILGLSVFL